MRAAGQPGNAGRANKRASVPGAAATNGEEPKPGLKQRSPPRAATERSRNRPCRISRGRGHAEGVDRRGPIRGLSREALWPGEGRWPMGALGGRGSGVRSAPRGGRRKRSGSEVFVTEWPQRRPGEGRWVRGWGVPGTGQGGSQDRL